MAKKVLIIDGQGGKIGAALVTAISALPCEVVAVGTNSIATSAMLKAGALYAATGENPVVVNSHNAAVIAGPIGIISANALLGEVTDRMALAVSSSPAKKVLLPVSRCNISVVGVEDLTMSDYISSAVLMIGEAIEE